MAEEATGWCDGCHRQVLVRRRGVNHVLHAILSLVTCGWWAIVWIVCCIRIGGWRCSQCGMLVTRDLLR